MAKVIAVFADGTGNSSSQLLRTNVWRLYQALDTTSPVEAGQIEQVAYYHNGVGTSSFRPLAILGGAFGWGLKRNIVDLYTFLCRTYQPGDHIYLFGFSRGAFTVRVLAAFVLDQGLVADTGDQELQMYARDAYRAFRRCFDQTSGLLVTPLRRLRDGIINRFRRLTGLQTYHERQEHADVRNRRTGVAFVGVWDTVAAYGTPIAELTRAIDHWIWPLSMPDLKLSDHVSRGRQALALDDERDTFHPLLWDERAVTRTEHLKQVWFAGVHSDVGGGYPDDALAYVPLDWMLNEAAQHDHHSGAPGLRFYATAIAEISIVKNPCAPLHDSRRGLAGYYRYQPRKLSARIDPPDQTTLLMQDPNPRAAALLCQAEIHDSVFERIMSGVDRYAPVVLPASYRTTSGRAYEPDPEARARTQERVWDWIWHKRVNYFLTVGVSVFLAALPLWQLYTPPPACVGPQCLLSPAIEAAGYVLPTLVQPWIVAFAKTPGIVVTTVVVLGLLLARSDGLQMRIRDEMRALWGQSLGLHALPPPSHFTIAWVRRLRNSLAYQRGWQRLKWRIVPNIFGISMLILFALAAALGVAVPSIRWGIWQAEQANVECEGKSQAPFATSSTCWDLEQSVQEGRRYRVLLTPDPNTPWRDLSIDTGPPGFGASEMSVLGNLSTPLRRSLSGRWFQPMAKIVPPSKIFVLIPLEMERTDTALPSYVAQFTATTSGPLFMFVNDVLLPPWFPDHRQFYENNQGRATSVTIEEVNQNLTSRGR